MSVARYTVKDHAEPLSDGSMVYSVILIDRDTETAISLPALDHDTALLLARNIHHAILDWSSEDSVVELMGRLPHG